jgi:UDP-N-acetyl-2-amino-2-deoxyglucuronate dehydrogenase
MAVRLGLVGCGAIGQKHLQALAHLEGGELTATADTDLERATAAALPFDAAAFDSVPGLLASGLVDAVIVATPSGLHAELAMAALEQGLDVLVEKPLALSWRDGRSLVDFAVQAGLVLAVTHFNRLLPAPQAVLEACRNGRLGRLLSGGVAVRWSRPAAYFAAAPWRGTRAMDGGMLFNQAVHALDLLVQCFGPAAEVFAYADTLTHDIEAEDIVAGTVRFTSGALATVNVTTSVPERNWEERITVVGEQGLAVLGPVVTQLAVLRTDAGEDTDTMTRVRELPPAPSWSSHLAALEDFVAAVERRSTPTLAAASALDTLALVEALTRSGMTKQVVRVPEITGEGVPDTV